MSYCSVELLAEYLGIDVTTDDALLERLLDTATKIIDSETGRTFSASDTTRYFSADSVFGDTIYFDSDICAITTVTNGDSVAVSANNYITHPRNETPYYAIQMKTGSSVSWIVSGDYEVSITGKWTYSATPHDDIVHCCCRLAAYLYRQKDNANDLDRAIVAGNSTILPAKLPADIAQVLRPYKRRTT